MKGLLIKDLKLLKNQRIYLLVLIAFAAVFVINGSFNSEFLISWIPFIVLMLTMSTLSYDDLDCGMQFLMTFPIERKEYVREKYLLGILAGGGSCILVALCVFLLGNRFESDFNRVEFLAIAIGNGIFLTLFLGLMIPIQIKFGSEKGRLVLYGAFGITIGAVYLTGKFLDHISGEAGALGEILSAVPDWGIPSGIVGLMILILWISYLVSTGIIEKKEF